MTTWYYGEGGNNGNSGLSFALRKATHESFRASIAPGDTVYICAALDSVIWDCTEQLRVVSGTSGNWVTYRLYHGFVRFDVSTTSIAGDVTDKGAINGNGNSWFAIEPTNGELILGNLNDWLPNDGAGGWYGYSAAAQLSFTNCHDFKLVGTGDGVTWGASNFTVFGSNSYLGNYFDDACVDFLIYGIDFARHGTNNTKTWVDSPEADDGDMVAIDGRRCVVDSCTFQYGGHQNIAMRTRSSIVRNSRFNGDWDGVTDNADAGRGAPIERSGSRSFALVAADRVHGATSPYGPNLIEGNIMERAGSAGDEHDNSNCKPDGMHVILRGNYIWDGCDAAIETATHDDFDDDTVGKIKVYNNTLYGNGRIGDVGFTVDVFSNLYHYCDFFNNICDQLKGAYFQGADIEQFRRRAGGESLDGFANGWKGGRYSANLAAMAASAPEVASGVTVEFMTTGGTTQDFTWSTVTSTYPSNWSDSNDIGSPTYAGNVAGGTRTKAAFAMNGGLGSGTAEYHARANGAGTNQTTLTVDAGQAYNFKGDWGFAAWLDEGPDWIQIGSTEPVQILSINYAAHSIVLSEARTWSDNDEVYLCTTEDGGFNFTVWTDIGASQSAAEITPDPAQPVMTPIVRCFK
jgi:hypothetical protein